MREGFGPMALCASAAVAGVLGLGLGSAQAQGVWEGVKTVRVVVKRANDVPEKAKLPGFQRAAGDTLKGAKIRAVGAGVKKAEVSLVVQAKRMDASCEPAAAKGVAASCSVSYLGAVYVDRDGRLAQIGTFVDKSRWDLKREPRDMTPTAKLLKEAAQSWERAFVAVLARSVGEEFGLAALFPVLGKKSSPALVEVLATSTHPDAVKDLLDAAKSGGKSALGRAAMEALVLRKDPKVVAQADGLFGGSKKSELRAFVAQLAAAAEPPSDDNGELLARFAADKDAGVREIATAGLGRFARSGAAMTALRESLTDKSAAVRAAGAESWGRARPSEGAGPVLPLADDPSPEVRIGALRGLVVFGGARVKKVFDKAVKDPDAGVREVAQELAKRLR